MRSCICEVRNLPKSGKCQPLGHNLSHLVAASMVAVVGFQSAVVWLSCSTRSRINTNWLGQIPVGLKSPHHDRLLNVMQSDGTPCP